jgi:hypothetical protein
MNFYGGTFTGDTFNGDTFNGGTFNGNAIGSDNSGLTTATSAQIATLISSLTTLVADFENLLNAGTSQQTTSAGSGSQSTSYVGAGAYDTSTQHQTNHAVQHDLKKAERLLRHMV